MANTKHPLRLRIANLIAGRQKEYVPALNPLGGLDWPGRSSDYESKADQIAALKGWVFAANSAIVQPTAAVELKLYRKKKDGDREEIKEHELLDLLDAPTNVHTGEQMRQLHFTYLNLVGESYVYMRDLSGGHFIPAKGRLPAALDLFPAHLVQFKLGETYTQSTVKLGQRDYPITSFIRDLNPDPGNPYVGQSIIRASASIIDTDEQMKQWNQNLFANNARPSLIFKTNEPLTDEAYKRWKAQFYDQNTGTDSAFKPLLIEGGDAAPYMLNQQDLDFLESRRFSRDEILAMFKVSPGMVGSVENVNRANLDAGFYINAVLNVVPRIRQFVKQLNVSLVKVYDPSLELDYVNPVPEDLEAKLAYAKAAAGNLAWLTTDEIRDLYGEKPLEEDAGVHVMVPGTVRTLETAAEDKTDPAASAPGDPNGDQNVDDPNNPDGKAGGKKHVHTLDGVKKKTVRLRRALNVATRR